MNAPELLATLRERGARVSARTGEGGAAVLAVAPRGVASDLAGEVARFKPALLELLEREVIQRDAANTVLRCLRRPGAGLRYGPELRAAWRVACEATGNEQMTSPELVKWARANCSS